MRKTTTVMVLALVLGLGGSAEAATIQFGGANAEPTGGCSGGGGTTFVQAESPPALSYAAPISGVVTSWSFVSGTDVASPIKLKVFRRTALPTDFTTVGESAEVTPLAHMHATFPAGIRVIAGDLLGLRSTTGAATDCVVPSYSFGDLMRGSTAADTAPGAPASLPIGIDRTRLTLGATIESDLDGDGLGDDSQDGDDDGDGLGDGADNCPALANPGQANLDGDQQGDACDDDDDGDGLADAVEAVLGANPSSTDTDGDGRRDGLDRCPTRAAGTNDGCPAVVDVKRPAVKVTGVAARTKRARFMKGVVAKATPDEPVALEFELLATARRATLARTSDVVLARRALPLAAGARRARLKPASQLVGKRKRFAAQVRVTATDAAGNRTVVTRKLRVR